MPELGVLSIEEILREAGVQPTGTATNERLQADSLLKAASPDLVRRLYRRAGRVRPRTETRGDWDRSSDAIHEHGPVLGSGNRRQEWTDALEEYARLSGPLSCWQYLANHPELAQHAAVRAFRSQMTQRASDLETLNILVEQGFLLERATDLGIEEAVQEHKVILNCRLAAPEASHSERLEILRYLGSEAATRGSDWLYQTLQSQMAVEAESATSAADQLALVTIRTETELRRIAPPSGLISLLEAWVECPDWPATWKFLATHREALATHLSKKCLEVFARWSTPSDQVIWTQHLEIIDRLVEYHWPRGYDAGMAELEAEHLAILQVDDHLTREDSTEAFLALAGGMRAWYQVSGARWLLERAIKCARRAHSTGPQSGRSYFDALVLLISMLHEKFGKSADFDSLAEAVKYAEEIAAIEVFPDPRVEAAAMEAAASAFLESHREIANNQSHLYLAILGYNRLIRLADGPADVAAANNNLANALGEWFLRIKSDRWVLELSVRAAREAVSAGEDAQVSAAYLHNTLASWLGIWLVAVEADRDLAKEATAHARVALAAIDPHDRMVPTLHNNLANRLADEVEQIGEAPSLLEEAVSESRMAVLASSSNDPDLPRWLANLCSHLRTLYRHHDPDPSHILEAVAFGRQALRATTENHVERPHRLFELATSLLRLYELQPDVSILREAAEHLDRATASNEGEELAETPIWLSTLAEACLQLYERLRDGRWLAAALSKSASSMSISKALHGEPPPEIQRMHGDILGRSFSASRQVEALNSAIDLLRDALDREESSAMLASLGAWLGVRGFHTQDLDDADAAVGYCRRARLLCNEASDTAQTSIMLADNLHRKVLLTEGDVDLASTEEAIAVLREALLEGTTTPPTRLKILWKLSALYALHSEPRRRLEALEDLTQLLQDLAEVQPAETTLLDLIEDGRGLSQAIIDAALNVDEVDRGIELLEQARGVRYGDFARALNQDLDAARALDAALVEKYETSLHRLRAAESLATLNPGSDQSEIRTLRESLALFAKTIRALPGLDRFSLAPSIQSIRSSLDPTTAVVYLTESVTGMKALILHSKEPTRIVDCLVDTDDTDRWVAIGVALPFGSHKSAAIGLVDQIATDGSFEAEMRQQLGDLAEEVWSSVVSPVLEMLPDEVSDLCLVACGRLGSVPFHVAGTSTATLVDHLPVRYGVVGRQASAEGSPQGVRAVVTGNTVGLAWTDCEALTVAALHGDAAKLRNAGELHACFDDSESIHFTGHADVEIDPMSTFLSLDADGSTFTVRDTEGVHPRPRGEFVISACSARTPSALLPDEVIGFPSAIAAAGFSTVIGAPWPIGDRVATIATIRYHEQRATNRSESPAVVLASVQRWLRRASNKEISAWATQLADRLVGHGEPQPELRLLSIQHSTSPAAELPFSHPIAWGALTATGR